VKILPIQEQIERILPILSRSPLFHGLEDGHLREAARHAELIEFEEEEALARQGDPSEAFYLLLKGSVSILREEESNLELARLSPPDAVGEMGVLLGSARSASVIALGRVQVLCFKARQFHQMMLRLPYFSLVLARTLATRLQEASQRIPLPELGDSATDPPPQEILNLLPAWFQARHRVVPLDKRDGSLVLGCLEDPSPRLLASVRQQIPDLELLPRRLSSALYEEIMSVQAGSEVLDPTGSPALDALLKRAIVEGASELHLMTGMQPRWRLDRGLQVLKDLRRLGPNDLFKVLGPILPEEALENFPGVDLEFNHTLPEGIRFRIQLFNTRRGPVALLRKIPPRIPDPLTLGLPEEFLRLSEREHGLILVSGPAGSGRSTTLASLIEHINQRRQGHILSLEDPVEFLHESQKSLISQRELGSDIQDLKEGLRSALRLKPDVLVISELSAEILPMILEAASDRLILVALRARSVASALERLLSWIPQAERNFRLRCLSEVFLGLLNQLLLRRNQGGRLAAFELLLGSSSVQKLLQENKLSQIPHLMSSQRIEGHRVMRDELTRLTRNGLIDPQELRRSVGVQQQLKIPPLPKMSAKP